MDLWRKSQNSDFANILDWLLPSYTILLDSNLN